MKVALGCDHGGIILKESVVNKLTELGCDIVDFGTYNEQSCDYPNFALKVANSVKNGECDCGVLMCGTGIGISITANKVRGIRCAVVHDAFTATATKQHNNANIIALGGRVVSPKLAAQLVELWLKTEYEGGRHQNRLDIISAIEDENFK